MRGTTFVVAGNGPSSPRKPGWHSADSTPPRPFTSSSEDWADRSARRAGGRRAPCRCAPRYAGRHPPGSRGRRRRRPDPRRRRRWPDGRGRHGTGHHKKPAAAPLRRRTAHPEVRTGDEHAVVLAAAALAGVPVGRNTRRRSLARRPRSSRSSDAASSERLPPASCSTAPGSPGSQADPELAEWHSRWLDYLAEWASAAPGTPDAAGEPQEVAAEAPALAYLLGPARFGLDRTRSNALVRAVLPALTLTSRWGLRRRLLEAMMAGLDAANEAEATAWALHQVGTQDAVEGRLTEARNNLTRALEHPSPDLATFPGSRATQQNLAVLDGLVIPLPRSEVQQDLAAAHQAGPLFQGKWLVPLAVGILAVAAVVAWLLVNAGRHGGLDVAGRRRLLARSRSASGRMPRRSASKRGHGRCGLTNIGIDDVTAFQLVDSPCTGTRLEPGASCDESIVFAPTQEGTAKAALLVSTEGSDTPLRVTLEGAAAATALASPSLSVSTPSLAPPVTPSPTPSAGPPNLVIGVLDVGRPVHETDGWHVPVSVVHRERRRQRRDRSSRSRSCAMSAEPTSSRSWSRARRRRCPRRRRRSNPARRPRSPVLPCCLPDPRAQIRIDVEADSCAIADPAHRKPCRVVESREDDNSLRSSVTLPAGPGSRRPPHRPCAGIAAGPRRRPSAWFVRRGRGQHRDRRGRRVRPRGHRQRRRRQDGVPGHPGDPWPRCRSAADDQGHLRLLLFTGFGRNARSSD